MKKVSIVTSRTKLCGQAITFVIFQGENFQVLNEQSLFSYLYLKPVRSRGSHKFFLGVDKEIFLGKNVIWKLFYLLNSFWNLGWFKLTLGIRVHFRLGVNTNLKFQKRILGVYSNYLYKPCLKPTIQSNILLWCSNNLYSWKHKKGNEKAHNNGKTCPLKRKQWNFYDSGYSVIIISKENLVAV